MPPPAWKKSRPTLRLQYITSRRRSAPLGKMPLHVVQDPVFDAHTLQLPGALHAFCRRCDFSRHMRPSTHRKNTLVVLALLFPLAVAYMLLALLTGSVEMHRFCGALHKGMDTAQVYALIGAQNLSVGPSLEHLEDAAWVHDPVSHGMHLCRLNFDGRTLLTATYELVLFNGAVGQ